MLWPVRIQIGQHCRDGQVLTVEWVANATAAPTPAQKKDNSDGATQRTQRAFAVGFMMTYFVVDIFF